MSDCAEISNQTVFRNNYNYCIFILCLGIIFVAGVVSFFFFRVFNFHFSSTMMFLSNNKNINLPSSQLLFLPSQPFSCFIFFFLNNVGVKYSLWFQLFTNLNSCVYCCGLNSNFCFRILKGFQTKENQNLNWCKYFVYICLNN